MLFNSLEFALFLPIVFALYWSIFAKNLRAQNVFLIAVSYLFYGWWDWRFLSLIIFSSAIDYSVGLALSRTSEQRKRKWWLGLSLFVNLGLLGFFKYYDFFLAEFIAAFAEIGIPLHASTLRIILPVGISFYTFQTLSYTIDVYREKLTPVKDWTVFFAYVSFFPQLVAGPIERATQLLPQFSAPRNFNSDHVKDGLRQMLWGLFKKIVIADNCASVVDKIFANHEVYGAPVLFLGAFLFAVQIYCDFSGYSDIALGTARLFGFRLMRNFAYPYFARDIAEFWRRWHISLSTWFRDYLYIPLGGSRVSSSATLIRNVFIVFIVSGFWHGANWTFIAWGTLHALYFIPSILLKRNRRYLDVVATNRLFPNLRELAEMLLTFTLVCIAWIFFRAENLTHAVEYLTQLFTNFSVQPRLFRTNLFLLFGIGILFLIEWLQREQPHAFAFKETSVPKLARAAIYIATAFAILLFLPQKETTFIYFQF
ncbi:MAG: MBOAT family protein [Saprospiraceae bacterium]